MPASTVPGHAPPVVVRGRRRVLLIAFHYPPFATSSGVQRSLAFSTNLPDFGWEPIVLTVRPQVYARADRKQLEELPPSLRVLRTRALDAARHLSIRGRYWSRLALPDRWASWWWSAVPAGLWMIRRHAIDAIWSTYPIATAHRIGATLSRLSGRPWVADFRDPMVEQLEHTGEWFPADPALRRARLSLEARAAQAAARLVFCTEGARQIVLRRYPALPAERTSVVSNGFEERAFRGLAPAARQAARPFVLLHSGLIYASPDRDPSAVMQAIRLLADRGVVAVGDLELRLRDPSNEAALTAMAAGLGVASFVSIQPQLTYREALREMLGADALLLLQGENSNPAIPAKLYEYLRAGRPIVACVHPRGETARTLSALGIDTQAPLTDPEAIAVLLERCLRNSDALTRSLPTRDQIAGFSREHLSGQLAALLESSILEP